MTEPAAPPSSPDPSPPPAVAAPGRRGLLRGAAGTLVLALSPFEIARGAALIGVRVWPAAEYTRVTLEHDAPLRFTHFVLRELPPLRLVVDIEGIALTAALRELVGKIDADDPYIAGVRIGQYRRNVVRLVFDLKADVRPQVFGVEAVGPYQRRLVLDLHPVVPRDPLLALLRAHDGAAGRHAAADDPIGALTGAADPPAPGPAAAAGAPALAPEPGAPELAPARALTATLAAASDAAASSAAAPGPGPDLGLARAAPGRPLSTGTSATGPTIDAAPGTLAAAPVASPTAAAPAAPTAAPPGAPTAAPTGAPTGAPGAAPTGAPAAPVPTADDPIARLARGDFDPASPPASPAAATRRPPAGARGERPARAAEPVQRYLTVALDPGHGGEDPGAVGRRGTYEKHVTLSIARRLAAKLEADPRMRVLLTRDGDYFVPLAARVAKARRVQADLFVSIHADAWIRPDARGSSVFALSERGATSTAAAWMARRENNADLIGGIDLGTHDPGIARVLLDLSTTAQINDSLKFGSAVLRELEQVNRLHKTRVEQAGFAVLKAPDIPSILVETAFISNPEEERRLKDEGYQRQLAHAIYNGIARYFERNPPAGRNPIG